MVVQPLWSDAPQVRAPNGVVWTRRPDGRSSAADLLRVLADLGKNHIQREWDWWGDGRRDKEHDRQWAVLAEWDNGAKDPPGFDPEAASKAYTEVFDRRMEEQRRAREVLAVERYDKERECLRLQMLAAEADAAFFGHVLEKARHLGAAGQGRATYGASRTTAAAMREQLGDPEDVVDRHGFFPADRRRMNLDSHMSVWWHPADAARAAREQAAQAVQCPAGDASARARGDVLGVPGTFAVPRIRIVALPVPRNVRAGLDGGDHRQADARMVETLLRVRRLPDRARLGRLVHPAGLRRPAMGGDAAADVEGDLRAGPAKAASARCAAQATGRHPRRSDRRRHG